MLTFVAPAYRRAWPVSAINAGTVVAALFALIFSIAFVSIFATPPAADSADSADFVVTGP